MNSKLFSSIRLDGLQLHNRIVVAPMCQYSAHEGDAQAWHTVHLGQLALSGASLVLLEATAVCAEGRISGQDLGLWCDRTERALGQTLAVIKEVSDTPLGIQLAHAGRKASTAAPWRGGRSVACSAGGWHPVAPSALPHAASDAPPHPLTVAQMVQIRCEFADAARRAAHLGLDAIEIHAAHGYLLHQFLSPLSNERTDAYGGSLDNRMRFTLEVFDAVREAFPAGKPVGVRLSATDWAPGGWDLNQSLALSDALKSRGASFLHVSSGGLVEQQAIPVSPNYQVPFARAVKAQTGLPTLAVGLITEPAQAEAIVASGDADMVALARAIVYDPRWPWHAAAALGARVDAPVQYHRCQPHLHKDLFER